MHPYTNTHERAKWKACVAEKDMALVDPVCEPPFKVDVRTKIATAGSCFAQHIARHLKKARYTYFMTEPPHPIMPEDVAIKYNYGTFSARYGNIYTTRQLSQLFDRAYGCFVPEDSIWQLPSGRYVDALRPQITPSGNESIEECEADRTYHLSRVRALFEECDVFIFTLGLTEAWRAKADGTVYPICPGVCGGEFSEEKYEFVNFSVDNIRDDLYSFASKLRGVNPTAKLMLTVSPVPLVATATDAHVLCATIYSKSVLRVAAEQVVSELGDAFYFPSYEIITGSFTRGKYFAPDLRSVTEAGVEHVMRLFFKHVASESTQTPELCSNSYDSHLARMSEVVETNCDEEALGQR